MSLPDPHAGEPTKEVPRKLVEQWVQARDAAAYWKEQEERLKAELAAEIGDAYAGTIDGEKVFTYRPINRYAEARLKAEYPDLVQHFIHPKLVDTFDVNAFSAQHPDVAERYRSRQFRAAE